MGPNIGAPLRAELFDLRDCAPVWNTEPVTSFGGDWADGNTDNDYGSFANPKSGLEQTRSRTRRKAGFPTSVVCTLRRALLSC